MSALLPLLAAVTLAGTPSPEDLSSERSDPTRVWLLPGATALDQHTLRRECRFEPLESGATLPAGLRAGAHVVELDCGQAYVFLDLVVEVGQERRSRWYQVALEHVSLEPPRRTGWERAPTVSRGWIDTVRDEPVLAVPLDQPRWEHPLRLAHGEPVELLDQGMGVVRTATGRVAVVQSGPWLERADPLQERTSPDERAVRGRFLQGRIAREDGWSLAPVPPSAELLERRLQGRAYELEIDPDWMSGEAFEADWLDPVQQVLRHDCDERYADEVEPCGTYLLDYRPLGAWWPDDETRVVGLLDGTAWVDGEEVPRLRVVVRHPWSASIEVSPEWDR